MTDVKLPEGLDFDFIAANRDKSDLWFTRGDLLAIHEQGRLAGLEEAINAVEAIDEPPAVVSDCVDAIRALAASDGGKGLS